MTGRIRDRATFAELARQGRRRSAGPVTVVYLEEISASDSSDGSGSDAVRAARRGPLSRLAFSVPRAVGPAVVRNRLRRRLRAIFAGLDAEGRVPPGSWLVITRPPSAGMSFAELGDVIGGLVDDLGRRSSRAVRR